jgi:hypothetical protein
MSFGKMVMPMLFSAHFGAKSMINYKQKRGRTEINEILGLTRIPPVLARLLRVVSV